jgi:hypothetical protein
MQYKVGDTVTFRVRCNGDPAVDNPTAQVFDETNTEEGVALTIGAGLTQVPGTKIVVGSFTPDIVGEWSVNILDDKGMDQVRQFKIGAADVDVIGGGITTVDSKIDDMILTLAEILANTAGGGHFG